MNQRLCAAHPHIIHLREAFLTPHHLGIAMEFADGGDLLDFIDTFAGAGLPAVPEAAARRVFQQMMVAVDYCHRLGIANRDIKVRVQALTVAESCGVDGEAQDPSACGGC